MEEDNNNNINNMNNSNNSNENKNGGDEIYVSDAKGGDFTGFQGKRSIAERRGFNSNAARINTALFRASASTTTPLASPVARSPRLTIPPGISPTALLDSPMMLPNSYGMPSPTTGTFLMMSPLTDGGGIFTSVTLEQGNLDMSAVPDAAADSFKFKPEADLDPNSLPSSYSVSLNQVSNNCHMVKGGHTDSQILVQGQPSADFSFPEGFSKCHSAKNTGIHFYNDVKMVNDEIANAYNAEMPISRSEEASDESNLPENGIHDEDVGRQLVLVGEQKEISHATGVVRTSEDGYNWRKYGQKQVKGSEYPRSYYKCTQPNCQVKKKVERSLDGQITEIIYKGSHNHAIPHPNRRSSTLPTDIEMSEMAEGNETYNRVDADSVWGNIQSGGNDTKHGMDWKNDGQERTPSNSVVTEISDPIATKKATSLCMFESEGTPELSSTLASHDGDEDGPTQALIPHEDAADDAESDSKRRKKENFPVEPVLPPRAVREPRVVVQIESEVDILDDGYRWRKYGQKVVKGNPNPRSYYKCTSTGCGVRKHVERASHNLKFVITTYEGKHNHQVPTARNSNQMISSDGGLPPSGANGALALSRSSSFPKTETHQTLTPRFDRKPDFSNEFLRSSLIGNFSHDMKFGTSSMPHMKYSSLNNTVPFGSYGLNPDRCAAPQAGPMAQMFPEFPMQLPLNLPSSGNFSFGGMNFNSAKPMGPVQSYLSGQPQVKEMDAGFLRPKLEQKDDTLYGTCIPPLDHASTSLAQPSASPTIYRPVMQNFPQ